MSSAAPALRRGRPRKDAPPRRFGRRECAALAGVGLATISHALNLYEESGGRAGLPYVVRRGPRVEVEAPALLRWVADGCPAGRWKEGTP
jgi:hypothetical protein